MTYSPTYADESFVMETFDHLSSSETITQQGHKSSATNPLKLLFAVIGCLVISY